MVASSISSLKIFSRCVMLGFKSLSSGILLSLPLLQYSFPGPELLGL